ncbi:MAG TPA: sensor histidine kinase [Actinomycetes bacterium]|nr:sensor histidine kinase [Actinomycetes bacterium]
MIVDGALGAGLAALLTVGTYFAAQHQPTRRPFDAGTIALVVVAAGALALRRGHPVAVLAAVFGATLIYFILGYANGPIWLALVVAYFTAAVRGHRLAAAIAAVAGLGIFPWLDYLLRNRPGPSLAGMAALAAWLLVLLGAAEAARIRRERAAEAVRIREGEALRRASEERLRIARELHDALGHHLSLINVQSGVALHLNEELPAQARSSLSAIRQASKEALAELRSVLDILRQEGEPAPRSPTSALARLDALVSQAAAAGLEVRTEIEGDVRPVPFGVDIAAFRIVQEALTNVTRHAGPATATVRVSYEERDLTVEVDDDGRGRPVLDGAGGGKGIVGMRERVATLGGELEAGPRPGGGFRVRARLPLDGAG